MKVSFFTILAALAASAIAAPFQAATRTSNAVPHVNKAMTMKRSAFKDSNLLKHASSVVGGKSKRDDDIAESVNYILVLLKDDDEHADAYQDEIDAVEDPSTVLGKRDDDIAESVNYILVLLKDDDEHADAYQDEIDAVADPATVLGKRDVGKRDDEIAESVNYILVLLKDDDEHADAYQDEIDAVNDPAEILG